MVFVHIYRRGTPGGLAGPKLVVAYLFQSIDVGFGERLLQLLQTYRKNDSLRKLHEFCESLLIKILLLFEPRPFQPGSLTVRKIVRYLPWKWLLDRILRRGLYSVSTFIFGTLLYLPSLQ